MTQLVLMWSVLVAIVLFELAGATSRSSAKYRLRERVNLNYPDKYPEVAAAAQYVQYTSPYDGHPSENNYLSRRQRLYGLITLNLPLLTMMGIIMFLPAVSNMSRRRRSLPDENPALLRSLAMLDKARDTFDGGRKNNRRQ